LFVLGKGDLAFSGDSSGEIQERQDQDSSSSIIYPQVRGGYFLGKSCLPHF